MIGSAHSPYAMAQHDPTWRLRRRITELNKALRGCQTHPNGMSKMTAERLHLDKHILQTEITRRRLATAKP